MKPAATSIDLHGVRHADVPRTLDPFLYGGLVAGYSQLTIVTGNSETMKDVVRAVLSDYGLIATEGWNSGELRVNLF